MGTLFDEKFNAGESLQFIDKTCDPWRISLCPSLHNPFSSKEVHYKGGEDLGFFVQGAANPPFTVSWRWSDDQVPGVPMGQLFLSPQHRVENMGMWDVVARRKLPKSPAYDPAILDTLTVIVLPEYVMRLNLINLQDPRRSWQVFTKDEFIEILDECNRILQTQANIRFVHNATLTRDEGEFSDGRLTYPPARRAPDPLRYYPTGILWDKSEIGCFGSSLPWRECSVQEEVVVHDPILRNRVITANFLTNLMMQRNTTDFDAYCVSEFVQPASSHVEAFNNGSTRQCLIQKKSVSGMTLAHEIGHWLFRYCDEMPNNHHPDPKNLMFSSPLQKRLTDNQIHCAQYMVSTFVTTGTDG